MSAFLEPFVVVFVPVWSDPVARQRFIPEGFTDGLKFSRRCKMILMTNVTS